MRKNFFEFNVMIFFLLAFNLYLQFLGIFFMDPDLDFPGRIRIYWLIRIGTQEKSLFRIWTKGPGSETVIKSGYIPVPCL